MERLETDVGPLYVHERDAWITPTLRATGSWEPAEGAWLRHAIRPGAGVIDCGAHVGYFTRLAAAETGPAGWVLAVEAHPANLALLELNVRGLRNVTVVAAAASDRNGLLALRHDPENTGGHETRSREVGDTLLVPALALDELVAGRAVDVIKIDVQGSDHEVVRGLGEALAANPGVRALVEFWLEGLEARDISPQAVLAGYRELERPLGLLNEQGEVMPANDGEILTAAERAADRFVNIELGARPS